MPTIRRTRPLAGVLISLLAVACSGVANAPVATRPGAVPTPGPGAPSDAPAASDAWLVVGRTGEDGLRVILASTGEELIRLPSGVPDETWGRLVTATPQGTTTLVQDLVIQPGLGGSSRTIEGAWRLPTLGANPMPVGVSADGSSIVLVEDARPASQGAAAVSRFAILDRSLRQDPTIVELRGSFEYDALSPSGSILYVVEHLPGPPDGHYRVRMVDPVTGALDPAVVADKTGSDEAMAGYPMAQAQRPDGVVFTLYRGAEHPFIHTLSSVERWALCIDLPAAGHEDAMASSDWGMTQSPAGRSTLAVNATLGLAVEIAPTDFAIRRSVTFRPSAAGGITLAKFGHSETGPVGRRVVAAPDGSTVFAAGPGGIVRIDSVDLSVSGRFLEGSAVEAIAVPPDGTALYALLAAGGRIVKLDPASGAQVSEVVGSGFDRLVAIAPW